MSEPSQAPDHPLEEVAVALEYLASHDAGGHYTPVILRAMAKDVRAAKRIADLLSSGQANALEYWRGFETRDGEKDLELLEALE